MIEAAQASVPARRPGGQANNLAALFFCGFQAT
jgi:hypothetical protein